jgi:hypothetical protein
LTSLEALLGILGALSERWAGGSPGVCCFRKGYAGLAPVPIFSLSTEMDSGKDPGQLGGVCVCCVMGGGW